MSPEACMVESDTFRWPLSSTSRSAVGGFIHEFVEPEMEL